MKASRRSRIITILKEYGLSQDDAEKCANRIQEVMKYGYRSDRQNSYYWAVIVKLLSDYWGYSPDEVHDILKDKFLRAPEPGKPARILSTTDLSTVEAEEYYENIRRWAADEFGVYIPLPSEL